VPAKKWVKDVKTESTAPPAELFKKDARTIARSLASKKVSPKGIGSGIRMLQYYINRAGKNLPESRHKVLERAKDMLQDKLRANKAKQTSRS
jgi:tRNA(adenine34) deaminase